ncbi:helix-turn-helix transcriptional regulator [Microbaculum marinum]|uniref:Helix-turn-helix domain-containing protein n=1 Tax=Microbaculum marinum TaxID=1764581 RepID=A0AAW9RV37_9HYPH
MHSSFAHDLKTARRRSGLSQADCGHLLGIAKRRVSAFESGKVLPSVPEICSLSLIFGRTFESLFSSVFLEVRTELRARLATMPSQASGWLGRFNRRHTLNTLAERLEDSRMHRA